jgi:hypothetical protein
MQKSSKLVRTPFLWDQTGWGLKKGIRRCDLCDREDREWEEAEEKGEDRINRDGEEAWAEVVPSAPAVIVSAQSVETKQPIKGVCLALKSSAPIVVRL